MVLCITLPNFRLIAEILKESGNVVRVGQADGQTGGIRVGGGKKSTSYNAYDASVMS